MRTPEQKAAAYAMKRALKRGELERSLKCAYCGLNDSYTHGHHHNGYDPAHWLDVIWLCSRCHAMAHGAGSGGRKGMCRRWHGPECGCWEQGTPASPNATVARVRILELRAAGLSVRAIAQALNDEGVSTISGNGGWHTSQVDRILKPRLDYATPLDAQDPPAAAMELR